MTILFYISVIGLTILTLAIFMAKERHKVAVLSLIPAAFIGYFLLTVKVPEYFGYAVPLNYIDMEQSKFLDVFIGTDIIVLTIMEKGVKEPRLVSIPKNKENEEQVKKLVEQSGKGVTILRPSQKGASKETESGSGKGVTLSDIETVPMTEQNILQKGE